MQKATWCTAVSNSYFYLTKQLSARCSLVVINITGIKKKHPCSLFLLRGLPWKVTNEYLTLYRTYSMAQALIVPTVLQEITGLYVCKFKTIERWETVSSSSSSLPEHHWVVCLKCPFWRDCMAEEGPSLPNQTVILKWERWLWRAGSQPITIQTNQRQQLKMTLLYIRFYGVSSKTLCSTRIICGTNIGWRRRTKELAEGYLNHRYCTSTTLLQRYWPIHTRIFLLLLSVSLMSARVLHPVWGSMLLGRHGSGSSTQIGATRMMASQENVIVVVSQKCKLSGSSWHCS